MAKRSLKEMASRWWYNASGKPSKTTLSSGKTYNNGSMYGIKKSTMKPSVLRGANHNVASPGRTYWYPGKGAANNAMYGDGNIFDQSWKSSKKKGSSTSAKSYGSVTYPVGNSYGNAGMAGSTASGVAGMFSPYQYMEYLADKNTAINIAMNRENNQFSANQAKLQRQYETEMSNTAHQREVKDLQAAGLNPILSANAGAAVPTGAAAGASNFAGADSSAISAMAGLVESAISANAVTSAASMQMAASMYGSDKNLEATKYSSNQSIEAAKYSSNLGLVGDVIRLIGTIGSGIAAGRGMKTIASKKV